MVFQASAIEYDPASQNTILDYEVKVYKRHNPLISADWIYLLK